jgi:enterochelin esterase-like enzyme
VIARARVHTTSRLLAGGTGAMSYNQPYHFGPLTDGSKAAESMRIPSTLDRLVNG